MRTLSIIIINVFIHVVCFAQVSIKGFVLDQTDKMPIGGANIVIKNIHGKLLSFATTNIDGSFTLTFKEWQDSLSLHTAMIGYKSETIPINGIETIFEIELEPCALQLHEVVVNADRIRENEDTITYIVNSFAQKQDRTIGDVLNRMPGIELGEKGKIKYQGTDINKFYIEGSDMLNGKYGIATNGIPYDAISSVEILENHQPMQVLRGLSFSDQAALNLKLKNNAKATGIAYGSVGGGWAQQNNGLWQGEIFTMLVSGKYQTLTTIKGNNTGNNLSDQLTDFLANEPQEQLSQYISLSVPTCPDMQSKRSYFNRSWMVSSSFLFKTKNNGEFKAQIDYLNDKVSAYCKNSTTYFIETEDKKILEEINSQNHQSSLSGIFSYEINDKSYYLKNILSTDCSWNNMSLNNIGTLSNLQNARLPEFYVNNQLKIIRRIGNKLVTFNSYNEWKSLPEKLWIDYNDDTYGQKITQNSFYTDERASFGLVFNQIVASIEGGISGYFRNLKTDLWGNRTQGYGDNNQLSTNYIRFFVAPKFEWHYKKCELTLNIPLNLYSYLFSRDLNNCTKMFISPSIATKIRLNSRMSVTLRGGMYRSPANLHNIYNNSILTDYRTFQTGIDECYTSSGQTLSLSYNFRNASKGIFIMAMGSYGWNRSEYGTAQNIIGDYIFYSYQQLPSDSHTMVTFINASKTLDFMRGAIGVKVNFRSTNNHILSQGINTDFSNKSFILSPFVNGNICSCLNWDFRFSWKRSTLNIPSISNHCSNNFVYAGSVTFSPSNLITWNINGELYRNSSDGIEDKNVFMVDSKITFNVSKQIEIAASVSNIFNMKEYNMTSYGDISQYERSYKLRNREFLISILLKK